MELAATAGLDGVNIRDVAATAEVSLGRVQHYFPTKSDLIAAAFDRVSSGATERIEQSLSELDEGASLVRAVLDLLAGELIPTSPTRKREMTVAFAFTARALVDPELAARMRTGYAELHALIVHLLTDGQRRGEIRDDVTVEVEADRYLALLEGLGVHVLLGHRDVESARRLATRTAGALFTGPDRAVHQPA